MINAGVLTKDLSFKIDEDAKEFSKAKTLFTLEADKIDSKYKKTSCDTYKLLMTANGYPSNPKYIHNPVRDWDVASYNILYENSLTNDNLEHDHIPSKEAVKNFLRKKGYNISGIIEEDVNENSTAIEVSKINHINGATYGGKQNQTIQGIKKKFFDSEDLRLATIRDMSYHYINSKNNQVIQSFFPLYKRNLDLCLYN